MNLAIVGSDLYGHKKRIKDFIFKCSEEFKDDLTINSFGGTGVVNKLAKKYALEFGAKYKEYNPAHTVATIYSVESETYYNRKFHPSHEYDIFKKIIWNSKIIFVFLDEADTNNPKWKNLEKIAKKFKKTVKFII
jgi:hypothetical protein